MARLFSSYIQSSLGAGDHKNFEAVVLEGHDLWHWWRDNAAPDRPWKRAQRIVENRAAFPGSLIQSSLGTDDNNFEVVVPLYSEGGIELWHLWHDNADVNSPWGLGKRITEPGRQVMGPASIIQSSLGADDNNFEVVVPVLDDVGRVELRHYWHDNSDVDSPWRVGGRVNDPSHEVLGGGCIFQSDFGADGNNFEVAAWVRLPDGQSVLHHYWHDNSDVGSPWRNGQVILAGVCGNGTLIQSSFGGGAHGNFEVAVPRVGPGGRTFLQHVWHDNSDVNLPWRLGQVITEVASADASAALFQSDYRGGEHGNFEVLVDECHQSLVAYWHPNEDVNLPWIRHAVLLGEPPNRQIRDTVRICQLTGEFDRTDWDGTGQPAFAFNRTEQQVGLRGTDLGVSFEHNGRLYFLFGDTWRVGESGDSHFDWDAIAVTDDTHVNGGISLTFQPRPPIVHGVSQGAFEVPLDGFSFEERMYVFFSTDHRTAGDAHLMGRSLLAVSENDGQDFTPLLNFSRSKFINVSVERARLSAAQSQVIGWPADTDVLWVWGSGRYRGSPVYLAVVNWLELHHHLAGRDAPLNLIELNHDGGPVLYFTGPDSRWSPHEDDAVWLFCAGDVGELSARHNAVFDRYFLTYNTGNPRGIALRSSRQPWGPWSEAITLFDPGWGSSENQPRGVGYGTFMHIPWKIARVDNVQDDAFLQGRRDDEWGGEYGPYQITRFTTGRRSVYCDLYYTLSTWNPYQSMLMRTRIRMTDLAPYLDELREHG